MKALRIHVHPTHPQDRLVRQAADIVRGGGVTDAHSLIGSELQCAKGDHETVVTLSRLREYDAIVIR